MWRQAQLLGVAILANAIGGCAGSELFHQESVKVAEDAGSVHLAVLSVAPWEARKAELQPTFTLNEQDALQKGVSATFAFDKQILRAFSASLGVGLPTSTVSETTTTSGDAAGTTTTTATATQARASGEAPAVGANPVPTPTAPPGVAPTATRAEISLDPMLTYWCGTALFQEVKLLNSYVRDAAMAPNSDAYLVRLQVSLMPLKRNLAYDTYCNIGFFADGFQNGGNPASDRKVRVVPLLVTDHVEAALEARSAERARRVGLALSAMVGGAGVRADASHASDEIQKALGNELNSVFTVGRLSDNTIRCRFGATYSPESRLAMVPQAHYVTLLLLVERAAENSPNSGMLHAVSVTRFVDCFGGAELPVRGHDAVLADARAVLASVGIEGASDEFVRRCLRAVAANSPKELGDALKADGRTSSNSSYIFTLLTDVRRRNAIASVEFFVPKLTGSSSP